MRGPVISADGHIDLPVLPETLFVDGAPRELRDCMPAVRDGERGRTWVTSGGASFGLAGGMGSAGRRYEPGQIRRADRMAETGLFLDQSRGVMRSAIPEMRIKDQDRDGVAGEVIYGILGAVSRVQDPEVAAVMVRVYNDFAAELARPYRERFAMIGCLPPIAARNARTSGAQGGLAPLGSAEAVAEEIRRCASLGLRGVELPVVHGMMPLWHPDWDPMWAAVQECALPLHLHTIVSETDLTWTDTSFRLDMAEPLAALLLGGALERFPAVRVVIGASGLGWIPHVLERTDYEWEDRRRDLDLTMRPSEYWRRQMYATFQRDDTGLALLSRLGIDNVMWGSGFPHPDGLWPDSQDHLDRMLLSQPLEVQRRLLHDTAADVYGFQV